MNQKFLCDFYRMTGKKYKRNIKSYLNIMFQHNVRYMYWWRKRNKKFIGKIARVFLFKYSRKYGLEIGNAKIEEGFYLGHPYNITINEESILGKNINIHKDRMKAFRSNLMAEQHSLSLELLELEMNI